MKCDEQSLREMLSSAHDAEIGMRILESVASGTPVVIEMADGSVLTLTERLQTVHTLMERFGWQPREPEAPGPIASLPQIFPGLDAIGVV